MSSINEQKINKLHDIREMLLFPNGILILSGMWSALFWGAFPVIFDIDPFTWWGKI